jgi:hypothetical protein
MPESTTNEPLTTDAEYEQPVVEDIETTDGPAVTAAGFSGPK